MYSPLEQLDRALKLGEDMMSGSIEDVSASGRAAGVERQIAGLPEEASAAKFPSRDTDGVGNRLRTPAAFWRGLNTTTTK
jgi:hypothetical protein